MRKLISIAVLGIVLCSALFAGCEQKKAEQVPGAGQKQEKKTPQGC